jgi:hypothetical protein
MATKELRVLRHRYRAAYTAYMHGVTALADATENGVWPTEEVRLLEERALDELMAIRQTLLDELYAHSMKGNGSSKNSR